MPAPQRFDAVIFDFNGVLFWDNDLHEVAWKRYSAGLRGTPLDNQELIYHVHGRVNRDIFAYILGHDVPTNELDLLAGEKEAIYRELCLAAGNRFNLSPGAECLLDRLAAASVPRAIATSSAWPNVEFYCTHLNLGRWFESERIIFDQGLYPGKPAPDIYLEAAMRLALPPGRCIAVEDSRSGVQAATAAGIGYVVALGPAEAHEDLLLLSGVSQVISNLGEFPDTLIDWGQAWK
jgi:beta-phosphoglucomutase-like phosphatase (HAD superfamily)